MKLIIDIPEEIYNDIQSRDWKNGELIFSEEWKAIHNGTPLPKGHTELVDRQIIADYVHSHIQEINTGYGDLNQHTNRILRMIEDYIDNVPTLIEADKAESGG